MRDGAGGLGRQLARWCAGIAILAAAAGCGRRADGPSPDPGGSTERGAPAPTGEMLDDPAVAAAGARTPPPPAPGRGPVGSGPQGAAADVPGAAAVAPHPAMPGVPPPAPESDIRVPPAPLPSGGPNEGSPPGSAAGTGSPPASFPPYDVAGSGDLSIRRFVLCKDVKDREPVEPARSFRRSRDGRIWVFLDAANAGSETRKLAVSFESSTRPGARTPPLALEIPPAPRHRTWAWATAFRPPGAYDAVVRDEAGAIVARGRFEVTD